MRYFLFITILFFTFIFSNCSNTTPETNSANNQNTNTNSNVSKTNSNNPLATNKPPETATTNNGQTIAPVIQNYYDALKKKDEAGAKKYLSAAALKYWEDEAKAEKKTWFAYLLENEDPIDEKREVRNEKIEGDTAIAEIKGGSLGVWTKIKFVKENGEWKFASPEDSPEIKSIPKSAPNSKSPNS